MAATVLLFILLFGHADDIWLWKRGGEASKEPFELMENSNDVWLW